MALPSGYTQLGYLRATGTQYINMFYQPKLFGRIECKFKFHTTGRQMLLGSWGSASNLSYVIEKTASNNYNTDASGITKSGSVTTPLNVDQWYELDYNLNQNYITINGNTFATTSGSPTCTRAWYLFASNDADDGVYLKANASIEYLRLYDTSGILVHNYIPAYSEYVNDYGLFDAVKETFHQNDGTGKFQYPYTISATVSPSNSGTVSGTGYYDSGSTATLTATPNSGYAFEKWISKRYYLLSAIESTGTQYIDTGVNCSSDIEFELEVAFTEISGATKTMIGATTNGHQSMIAVNNNEYYIGWAEGSGVNGNIDTNYHKFKLENNNLYFDDTYVTSSGSGYSNTSLNLFRNNYSSNYQYCKAKLRYCKIKKNGVLFRNFIPCMDYTNLTPGLLDLVEMKFYGNSGTGDFQAIEPGTGEYISTTDNPFVISNINNFLDFTAQFKSTTNCRYKVNGTWKNGTMYIKENGTWKSGTPKIKINGNWKEGG